MRKFLIIQITFLFFIKVNAQFSGSDITSFKKDNYEIKLNANILITFNASDLSLRKNAEQYFVDELNKIGINAVSYIILFPPLREYDQNYVDSILNKNKITMYLSIDITDVFQKEVTIPESYSTHSTYIGNGNIITEHSRTDVSGGQKISKPRMNFDVEIFDYSIKENIWKASVKTRGNAFSNYDDLCKKLAKAATSKIKEDFNKSSYYNY